MKYRVLPSGYRSKFEERIAALLTKAKLNFKYEPRSFKYTIPVPGCVCLKCGAKEVGTTRNYTPDFEFKNGIKLETKGKFTGKDRKKMKAMRQQYPDMDLRMLFMADNKLSKASKTRYSDWCKENDIPYAVGKLPPTWLKEFKK